MIDELQEAVRVHGRDWSDQSAMAVLKAASKVEPSRESVFALLKGQRSESQRCFMEAWEFAIVEVGLQHVRAVASDLLFEELLEGVKLESVENPLGSFTRILPPDIWLSGKEEGWNCYPQLANRILFGLLEASGKMSKRLQAVKDAITWVELDGHHSEYAWDRDFAVDLEPMAALPNLEALSVSMAHPLVGYEGLRGHSSLRYLAITGSQFTENSGQGAHPMTHLLAQQDMLPQLTSLVLRDNEVTPFQSARPRFDCSALEGRALRSLTLDAWADGSIDRISDLVDLEYLHLSKTIDGRVIEPLKELRDLRLEGALKKRWSDLGFEVQVLAELPKLRYARLPCCPCDSSLEWTCSHPALEVLELSCEGKKGAKLRRRITQTYPKVRFI